MKRFLISFAGLLLMYVLIMASISEARPSNKVLDGVLAQESNKTQLENMTRAVIRAMAMEKFDGDAVKVRRFMGSYHTMLNAAWSDWRKRKLEEGRSQLETTVQKAEPNARVSLFEYAPSSVDPNSMSAYYLTEVPMNLERN